MDWGQFTAAFPAFADGSYDGIGPAQLALSSALLSKSTWDEMYEQGVALDCAHNLILQQAAAGNPMNALMLAAGPISSTSVAGTSTSFNSVAAGGKSTVDDFYNKTIYGQQFLRLRHAVCDMVVLA